VLSAGIKLQPRTELLRTGARAHMRLRERGCAIVQTNVASVLASGLSGPPRASGNSGFTHPLIEVFHPLSADQPPPSLQQPAKRRHRFDLGWSGQTS